MPDYIFVCLISDFLIVQMMAKIFQFSICPLYISIFFLVSILSTFSSRKYWQFHCVYLYVMVCMCMHIILHYEMFSFPSSPSLLFVPPSLPLPLLSSLTQCSISIPPSFPPSLFHPHQQLLPGDNDLCQLWWGRLLVLSAQQVERPHRGRPRLPLVHMDHGCLHSLLLQRQKKGQLPQEALPGVQEDHHIVCHWSLPKY